MTRKFKGYCYCKDNEFNIQIHPFCGDDEYFLKSIDGKNWNIVNHYLKIEKSFDNLIDAMKEILTYT